MEIFHPLEGSHPTLTLTPELRAIVAKWKALPTREYREYHKDRWLKMGIGSVPAGRYTDPSTPEAAAAVERVYHALKGAPITRPKLAMLLGFVSSDHVDDSRAKLYKAGADITKCPPGVSTRSTRTVDVIAAEAAKTRARLAREAKKAAKVADQVADEVTVTAEAV